MPRLTVLSLCILFLGCASAHVPYDEAMDEHMINIDRNGNYVPYKKNAEINFSANEEQVRAAIKNAKNELDKAKATGESGDDRHGQSGQEIGAELKKLKDDYDEFLKRLYIRNCVRIIFIYHYN